MIIGIDASRAFIKQRTGIEEYSYQTIKNLRDKLNDHQVVLYMRKEQRSMIKDHLFALPANWRVKVIRWPYLWTQLGLSLEMFFHSMDKLFIPAHIVPLIHPRKTLVVVHGLEYECVPEAYSFWERIYMRLSIKFSCRFAQKIIAVSENTKKDLINLYKVPSGKIEVIYEGYDADANFQFPISNFQSIFNDKISKPFLLSIGRIETRKNIEGILDAYKILVEKYKIPHALVLAGTPDYGYEIIKLKIQNYLKIKNLKLKIIELGYVSEIQKRHLLSNAAVFLFPSFYEGFGLPILEAQSAGVPVVASIEASIPEVAGEGALLIDPKNSEAIAEGIYKIISDENLRNEMIKKGRENVQRFSWDKCATQIARILEGK
jgi:glycosyltransferase involved in cell wall biosynthesis